MGKRKKEKRGGKMEEMKGIVVKKRENILILFPCLIWPPKKSAKTGKNFKKFQAGNFFMYTDIDVFTII